MPMRFCASWLDESVLYTALYMAATRTQIYLTTEQRRRLDERGRSNGLGLAEMIRDAVDTYLGAEVDLRPALDATFGALPDLDVSSDVGWERGTDPR
jgi:hypothetical protein